MIRRTVREWDYLPVEPPGADSFTRAHADRIVECAAACNLGGADGDRIFVNHPSKLRAQQTVGVIATPGAVVEILPKIDGQDDPAAARRSLVHMLAAVLDLQIADGAVTELSWQNEDLLEILIRLFCDRLFEQVHRGLPRRYLNQTDDLRALRGRMDVIRQFTVLAASPDRLACRYDDLSVDIVLNQIMKAAVDRLAKVTRAPENRRRLTELAFAFADVSPVPVSALPWDKVVIDRTNRTWAQLVSLAKLLLGNRFQTTSFGSSTGFALLFEMNTLFEEFIGRMTQRALAGQGFQVRLQGPRGFVLRDLATDSLRFATKPDICIRKGAETSLIIDTKWKRLKGAIDDPKQGVGQADIYQMMAYAQVYQTERLLLLYPHHGGLAAPPGIAFEHIVCGTGDTRILVGSVSLSQPRLVPQELAGLLSPLVAPFSDTLAA